MAQTVFISHAHVDARRARKVTDLLRSTLSLDAERVVCSSNQETSIAYGDGVAESLRERIRDAGIVIGLLSRESIVSTWVACELGAAWGLGRTVIPILVPPLRWEELQGPLRGTAGPNIGDRIGMAQVVREVGEAINARVEHRADRLVAALERYVEGDMVVPSRPVDVDVARALKRAIELEGERPESGPYFWPEPQGARAVLLDGHRSALAVHHVVGPLANDTFVIRKGMGWATRRHQGAILGELGLPIGPERQTPTGASMAFEHGELRWRLSRVEAFKHEPTGAEVQIAAVSMLGLDVFLRTW